jgi:hypothetical protein
MDFRRSGQLDERRRRVLMDEIASPADADNPDAAATGSSAKGPVRAYHAAVLSERQPKVTDLLPVRPLWVVVLLLLGLTGIATIEAIHVHTVTLPLANGAGHLAALDANQPGSLAAWYSSAMLAAAAALALVVFGIRSHRVDDYRGRYRIWLWTAAALLWLSLDAATRMHNVIGLAVTLLAGKQVLTTSLATGCTITWIGIYGLILGSLGLRLAFEVWPSLLSFSSLLIAGLLYLIGGMLQLEMLSAPDTIVTGTVESTVLMLAHLSLLSAIGFFARHVYLDATGRLKVRIDAEKKSRSKSRAKLKVLKSETGDDSKVVANKTEAKPAAGSKPAESAKFGAANSGNSSAGKPGATISKGSLSSPQDDDDEYDDDYGGDNLSKSERRRLKKLARREQRRAA